MTAPLTPAEPARLDAAQETSAGPERVWIVRAGYGLFVHEDRGAVMGAPYVPEAHALAETQRANAAETALRERTDQLDAHLGTPCEQVRHEQERDALRAQVARLTGERDEALRYRASLVDELARQGRIIAVLEAQVAGAREAALDWIDGARHLSADNLDGRDTYADGGDDLWEHVSRALSPTAPDTARQMRLREAELAVLKAADAWAYEENDEPDDDLMRAIIACTKAQTAALAAPTSPEPSRGDADGQTAGGERG